MISGRGWHGQLFFDGLGLSLGAKVVSTNRKAFNVLNKILAFSEQGRKQKFNPNSLPCMWYACFYAFLFMPRQICLSVSSRAHNVTTQNYSPKLLSCLCFPFHASWLRAMRSCSCYKLVQVKRPKFSPPRMPLAILRSILSKSEYLVSCWPLWPVEEGDIPIYFLRPWAVSRSETRIDQWQAFDVFNNIYIFPSRGENKNCAAFCTIQFDVLQGMSVECFAQKMDIWPGCVQH